MTTRDADPPVSVGVTDDRIIHVSSAARTVHRAILRSFADTGHPPAVEALAVPSGTADLATILAELHDRDIICLDDAGQIRAAYPFSASPTPHAVDIAGGPTVYAMCAVDALGMAAMLGRDIVIRSTDPGSGEPITVTIRNGQPVWRPATTVVYVGVVASECGSDDAGRGTFVPAADRCCTVMNFFTDHGSAERWRADHPDATGAVFDQDAALRRGVAIFGRLLRD
jgi:hypothetical protein